jgi:hypothetical protein
MLRPIDLHSPPVILRINSSRTVLLSTTNSSGTFLSIFCASSAALAFALPFPSSSSPSMNDFPCTPCPFRNLLDLLDRMIPPSDPSRLGSTRSGVSTRRRRRMGGDAWGLVRRDGREGRMEEMMLLNMVVMLGSSPTSGY